MTNFVRCGLRVHPVVRRESLNRRVCAIRFVRPESLEPNGDVQIPRLAQRGIGITGQGQQHAAKGAFAATLRRQSGIVVNVPLCGDRMSLVDWRLLNGGTLMYDAIHDRYGQGWNSPMRADTTLGRWPRRDGNAMAGHWLSTGPGSTASTKGHVTRPVIRG